MHRTPLLSQILALVDRLADHYGSECTSGGSAYETDAEDIEHALAHLVLPGATSRDPSELREWTRRIAARDVEVVPLPFSAFEALRGGNLDPSDGTPDEFVALAKQHAAAYAKIGKKGFVATDETPGLFHHGLLLRGSGCPNVLVVFPCVWT